MIKHVKGIDVCLILDALQPRKITVLLKFILISTGSGEGIVAWCCGYPVVKVLWRSGVILKTLQPEQPGGVGLKPGRAPPLECHSRGSRTRIALSYFCDPSACR